jgi:hypothetical protein
MPRSRHNRGMSDEPAKTVDPRPFNWGTPEKITAFLCVNLLAAYVPAVVCIMHEPTTNPALAYLCSPFLFALLLADSSNSGDRVFLFFLAALMLLLIWASVALRKSWKTWVAIPIIVFVYSLLQSILCVGIFHALNSHG